jgi:hypothetical protein
MEIEAGLHDLIRRVFFSEPVSALLENPLDDAAGPVLSAIPAKSQPASKKTARTGIPLSKPSLSCDESGAFVSIDR